MNNYEWQLNKFVLQHPEYAGERKSGDLTLNLFCDILRTDPMATMQIVGRDQKDQELTLKFNQERCVWELTKTEVQTFRPLIDKDIDNGNF